MFRPQRGEIGVGPETAPRGARNPFFGASLVADPCFDPRLAVRDQYFLDRLLAVTDTNEGDYASISGLVGTNPHKLQVTAIDGRLQRVATATDNFDCRQSHFAAIGQQHRPPVANDSASSGCKIPAFSLRAETVGYAMDKTVRNVANEKFFGKSVNPQ
jgi:hypothetical protein